MSVKLGNHPGICLRRVHSHPLLAVLFVLAAVACTKQDNLTPLPQVKVAAPQTNGVGFDFCTDPEFQPKQYVKMIVILDHSESNQKNYQFDTSGDGLPLIPPNISDTFATDPKGTARYGDVNTPGTLLNYLQNIPANNPADPTHFFSLIDFNDSTTTYPAFLNAAANPNVFTSDTVDFFNHVLAEKTAGGGSGPSDGGGTNYPGALTAASQIITHDITNAKNCASLPLGSPSPGPWCPNPGVVTQSYYVVVFMSDGSPIDSINGIAIINGVITVTGAIAPLYYDGGPNDTLDFSVAQVDILGSVLSLVGLAGDPSNSKYVAGFNLFTIYYFSPNQLVNGQIEKDNRGISLLAEMAKAGNGIAFQSGGTPINYFSFQPPAKVVRPKLVDVFVTDASTIWWNGTLMADTDMDGLPDAIEQTFGSNPNQASSMGNSVGDLANYIHQNGVAGAPTNFLTGACATIGLVGPVFQASDPDGMNDCEKTIFNDASGIGNFDSNGDDIPDWLEYINGVPFQTSAPSAASNNQVQDGYTLYQKIKYSLPVNIPAGEVLDLQPSVYNMTQTSTTAAQDCYHLDVENLPLVGSNNMVRIDVVERDPLSSVNAFYRVGHKRFNGTDTSISFKDWTDPGEIAAGTWVKFP